MNFHNFCQFLDKLDSTSKRLEMTDILSDLISELNSSEIRNGIYLSLGTLKAPFEDLKFNLADKQMIKTLAVFSGENIEKINQIYSLEGDLGSVGFKLSKEKTSDLSLTQTYNKLVEIDEIEVEIDEKPKSKTKSKKRVVSVEDLEIMMHKALENEEYEIAAEIRDRIQELKEEK